MSKTRRYDHDKQQPPRKADRIRDPKELRDRLEAFSRKPKPDLSAIHFATLRRMGMEF